MLPTGRNGPLPGLALAESPELRDIVLSDRQLGMLLEFLLDGDSVPESYNSDTASEVQNRPDFP